MNRKKITTIVLIMLTLVIAGVAIFTALRLYGSGQDPVAPTAPSSQPFAWDCSNYTFLLDDNGLVTVNNSSTRDEPSQKAEVYINDQLIMTLDVPALSAGDSESLGSVSIPSEPFKWKIIGSRDCQNAGSITPVKNSCESISFDLVNQPTATPTGSNDPSATPSPSPTPTDNPIGGDDPSPTPQPTSTPVPTSTSSIQSTATPTQGDLASGPTLTPTSSQSSQTSSGDSGSTGGAGDELPDSGFDDPIILFGVSSLLILIAAFILAF